MCQSLGDPAGVTFRADRGIAGIAPGSPAPFLAVAVIECASVEVLQTFLAAHGATLMADIPNYTSVQPVIQIGERVA